MGEGEDQGGNNLGLLGVHMVSDYDRSDVYWVVEANVEAVLS